jgi:acyl carrier protein
MDVVRDEVAAIWRELFQIEEVSADANFFALGGDSVMAMMMSFSIGERLGVDLPGEVLFDAPTFGALVAQVQERAPPCTS